jgi:hypothetical protein
MNLLSFNSLWKKALFSLMFGLGCLPAFAQSNFYSCSTREYCDWDTTTSTFVNCQPKDESSLFKLNADQTIFEHTTADIKSAYYVSKHEHDAVNNVEVYDVTSDVGNKYTFIVDTPYSEVRILGTSGDAIYMLRFHIKSTWTD